MYDTKKQKNKQESKQENAQGGCHNMPKNAEIKWAKKVYHLFVNYSIKTHVINTGPKPNEQEKQ